ncbi:MAG: restriction endonuclease subunit S [Bacteroidales bacterium]|nr:restriction endonuclease subunit S [Bacteroidales bacterium]
MRFREFSGEWESSSLGQKGTPYNGLSRKNAADFGDGSRFITYKSIFDSSRVDIQRTGLVNITDREREKGTQNKVRRGDIFFTVSSETPEEVGMSSVLLDDVDDCYLNSFCFGYRLSDADVRSEFLRFYLRSPKVRKKIAFLAQGSTRFNISKDEILNMSICIPNADEQKKTCGVP